MVREAVRVAGVLGVQPVEVVQRLRLDRRGEPVRGARRRVGQERGRARPLLGARLEPLILGLRIPQPRAGHHLGAAGLGEGDARDGRTQVAGCATHTARGWARSPWG